MSDVLVAGVPESGFVKPLTLQPLCEVLPAPVPTFDSSQNN